MSAAPSRMCAAVVPAISTGFLIALGSTTGSRASTIVAPARPSCVEDRRDRALGIDGDALAGERVERAAQRPRAACRRTALPRCGGDRLVDLLGGDEQVGGAIGVDQRIGERDRRAADVLPAHVERPGDRIERREHDGVGALLGQPVGDRPAAWRRRTGRRPHRAGRRAARRRARDDRSRPHRPDWSRPRPARRRGWRAPSCGLNPALGVQPGIIADPRAGAGHGP